MITSSKLHYRPANGYFGDTIPFYWEGQYHVFYLEGQFDPYRRVRFTPFNHLFSTNLVNWEELPVALDLGAPQDVDMSLGTGTVIAHDGCFYLLYCGRRFNPTRETVCLATSQDLVHWEKSSQNPILLPDEKIYAASDFRDPFPFWIPEQGRFGMVIASKLATAGTPQPGCLGFALSEDLRHWVLQPPFYAPHTHSMALECPDLFEDLGHWHLIYSADGRTCYRSADDLAGPWQATNPDNDDQYYRGIYAPKTLFDGQRRFLFGWIGTREGERDEGEHQWGGDMLIPRELVARPGGALVEVCPPEILAACPPLGAYHYDFRLGRWQNSEKALWGRRQDGLAYAVVNHCPQNLLVDLTVKFAGDSQAAGVIFRAQPDLSTFYALRLEPSLGRVVIQRWQGNARQNRATVLAERPLSTIAGQPVHVQLFIDGDIIEAFVNQRTAMCCRAYDFTQGELGFFVENGEASFEQIHLKQLPEG
jgi:beta-fructofuranosidase